MASEKGVVASGADFETARRRNVPASTTNALAVDKVEIDDKKTQVKKVGTLYAIVHSAESLLIMRR